MPHVWDVLGRFDDPVRRGADETVGVTVLRGAWYTFRLAMVGFALGTAVGLALAVIMQRFRLAEQGLLPFIVLSQTVPLVALAPLVVGWGGNLSLFGTGLGAVDVGVGDRRVPGLRARRRRRVEGPAVAPAGVGRADGLLCRVVEPDPGQAPLPCGRALPRAGPEAGRRGIGRGGGRGRDLHRHPRWHRSPHHRVRPRGHLRPLEGLHGHPGGRPARPGRGRAHRPPRPVPHAEPSEGGDRCE